MQRNCSPSFNIALDLEIRDAHLIFACNRLDIVFFPPIPFKVFYIIIIPYFYFIFNQIITFL